jgi:hypothetical protein
MRHLVEQDAATLRSVEFLRSPRAIEIVGVVEAVNEPEPAQFSARDDVAHQPHRRIERMGMADDQMHVMPLDRRDDGVAIGERQRHRLFQNDVLAVLRSQDRVRRMELVRRGDIDDLDRGIRDQHLHVGIGPRVVVAGEGLARSLMRVGAGPQQEIRMGRGGMHHHRPGHAEADNSKPGRLCSSVIWGHCRIGFRWVFLKAYSRHDPVRKPGSTFSGIVPPQLYPPSLESPSRHGHED